MSEFEFTKDDLPQDWTGWNVFVVQVNRDVSPPATSYFRGAVLSWQESGPNLMIPCRQLEKRAVDGPWFLLESSLYQTSVERFTLAQDPDTRIITFYSSRHDETFYFTPPGVDPPETPPD